MPWAQRGPHRYFFRKRKVGGRVVRRSYGRGPEAQLAATLDAKRQREREALWAVRRLERQHWIAATQPLNELIKLCELFVWAALLAAGFHQHESSWRKRRHHGVNGRD